MSVAPAAPRVGHPLVRSGSSVVNVQQPRVFERPEALSACRPLVRLGHGAMRVQQSLVIEGFPTMCVQQPPLIERPQTMCV